jgi:hypothetical protein
MNSVLIQCTSECKMYYFFYFFITYNKILNKLSRTPPHPLALTVNANSTALLLAQEIQLSWEDKLIIQQDRSDKETGAPTSLFRRDKADWQD